MTVLFDVLPAALAATAATAGTGAAVASSVGSIGALAGGLGVAAGSTAAVAGGVFGTGISLASILSGGLAIGSIFSAISGGAAESERLKTQAIQSNAQAEEELARGAEEARRTAREVARIRGDQDAVFLANGLDIGIGTPINIAQATRREADRQLSTGRRNARNRATARRLRSRSLNSEARVAFSGGIFKGLGIAAKTVPLFA